MENTVPTSEEHLPLFGILSENNSIKSKKFQ
jgi:hypothetical protein